MQNKGNESPVRMLHEADWDSIAYALINFDITLETNGKEGKKLQKELGVIKHVMYEHIKNNGSDSISLSFFVGTVKTIRKVERRLEQHNEGRREFLRFLELLLGKFRKQRLYDVPRPMEMKEKFRKMKGVVENETNPL